MEKINVFGASFLVVSIPQAVSTIAICIEKLTMLDINCVMVSIPQAVSTIAIDNYDGYLHYSQDSFNTASGKYYCND